MSRVSRHRIRDLRSALRCSSLAALLSLALGSPVAAQTAGTLDATFGVGGKMPYISGDGWLYQNSARRSDGKTVVVGQPYPSPVGVPFTSRRYNADGTNDLSWPRYAGDPLGPDPGQQEVRAVAVQSDNKVYLAGTHYFPGNDPNEVLPPGYRLQLMRLLDGGAVDTSFPRVRTALGAAEPEIAAILLSPQGIYVAGAVNTGVEKNSFVARYTYAGTLDASFGPSQPTPGIVTQDLRAGRDDVVRHLVAVGTDVIAVGGTTGPLGTASELLAFRLRADGSRDMTYATTGLLARQFGGAGDTMPHAVARGIVNPQQLLIAGEANGHGFVAQYGLADGAALTPEVTLLPSLRVRAMAVQPDGKAVLAGSATTGTPDALMVRVLPNLALDATMPEVRTDFFGAADEVRALSADANDRLLAFTQAGATDDSFIHRLGVARYLGHGATDVRLSVNWPAKTPLKTGIGYVAEATAVVPSQSDSALDATLRFSLSSALISSVTSTDVNVACATIEGEATCTLPFMYSGRVVSVVVGFVPQRATENLLLTATVATTSADSDSGNNSVTTQFKVAGGTKK